MTAPLDDVAAFGARLRAEGVPVDPLRLARYAEALALLGPERAYAAGRTILAGDRSRFVAYDRAFRAHYGTPTATPPVPPTAPGEPSTAPSDRADRRAATPTTPTALIGPASPPVDPADDPPEPGAGDAASDVERLRHRRFDACTDAERARLDLLLQQLRWPTPPRSRARRHPARRGPIDVRRTLRRSLRTGAPTVLLRHRRARVPRRLVLLLDVSGSMAAASRALLLVAHAALRERPDGEVLCFATRTTRLTPALRVRDPDTALREATAGIADWDGGTRIGDAVTALLDDPDVGRAVRGAAVVLCSDGLERGEPAALAAAMARLRRRAHLVAWVNPLAASAGYRPTAHGMAAALPHVDLFAAGDRLVDLERFGRRLAAWPHRPSLDAEPA